MKSRATIVTEALCYITIAAAAPWVELLISDREMSQRALMAAAIMAVAAGANALKAFLSQSMQNSGPMKTEITNEATNPVPTTEATKKPQKK